MHATSNDEKNIQFVQLYKEHNGLRNSFCTRTNSHDEISVKEIITNIIFQDFGKDDVKKRLKVD